MSELVFCGIISYLIGSIPFAYIVVKLFAKKNVLFEGSGNVGAMNSYEITGKKYIGVVVFVLDFCKGICAIVLAKSLFGNDDGIFFVASFLVVLGHNFSIFLKFRGGRGLATAAGVLLLFNPFLLSLWCIYWLFIYNFIFKDIHFANSIATILTPFSLPLLGELLATVSFVNYANSILLFINLSAMAIVILIKHVEPIKQKFSKKNS